MILAVLRLGTYVYIQYRAVTYAILQFLLLVSPDVNFRGLLRTDI